MMMKRTLYAALIALSVVSVAQAETTWTWNPDPSYSGLIWNVGDSWNASENRSCLNVDPITGYGTETRTVACYDVFVGSFVDEWGEIRPGSEVDSALCLAELGPAPWSTRECRIDQYGAGSDGGGSPRWKVTPWSACESGVESRQIACVSERIATGTMTMPDRICIDVGAMDPDTQLQPTEEPWTIPTSRSCATDVVTPPPLPVFNYSWNLGRWSSCRPSGVQIRSSSCLETTRGQVVPDQFCTDTAPENHRSCQFYAWQYGNWSGCVDGARTRPAACSLTVNGSSQRVDVDQCRFTVGEAVTSAACAIRARPQIGR